MRYKLISCNVFFREMCLTAAQSPHQIDLEFLSKGLHDQGAQPMLQQIQAAVDRVDGSQYDAILLGYALCNNGLVGLTARNLPLVVPRAHDCISLFMGSSQRYLDYFDSHPGVYFQTSGWIERGHIEPTGSHLSIQHKTGMDLSYAQLVEKYGEENAQFLKETLNEKKNYGQYTFIEMGIEPNASFEEHTQSEAAKLGWKFEKVKGDMGMIQRLLNGPWEPQEFLVIEPGWHLEAKYDGSIIGSKAAEPIAEQVK